MGVRLPHRILPHLTLPYLMRPAKLLLCEDPWGLPHSWPEVEWLISLPGRALFLVRNGSSSNPYALDHDHVESVDKKGRVQHMPYRRIGMRAHAVASPNFLFVVEHKKVQRLSIAQEQDSHQVSNTRACAPL